VAVLEGTAVKKQGTVFAGGEIGSIRAGLIELASCEVSPLPVGVRVRVFNPVEVDVIVAVFVCFPGPVWGERRLPSRQWFVVLVVV